MAKKVKQVFVQESQLRKKEKKKIDKVRVFPLTPPSDARRDARALGRVDATRVLPSRALPRRRRAP